MARPRELFNTPAPQAMSQMGQGIADAYARAGEIEGKGYMALGQGIAQGITSAASAVAGYMKEAKQLESQNKSYENLLKNSLVQNMLFQDKQGPEGVITAKDQASQFIAQTADMKPSEKNMVYNMIVPPAIGQYYKMQQIEAEQKGMFNRAMAGKEPTPDLAGLGQGLRQVTGVAAPAPQQPAAPAMQFDVTGPAQKLQNFMSSKYGPDYKSKGIRASAQDVMDAGL
jgi:hypothetical protein